jgi:hypothetical protein
MSNRQLYNDIKNITYRYLHRYYYCSVINEYSVKCTYTSYRSTIYHSKNYSFNYNYRDFTISRSDTWVGYCRRKSQNGLCVKFSLPKRYWFSSGKNYFFAFK